MATKLYLRDWPAMKLKVPGNNFTCMPAAKHSAVMPVGTSGNIPSLIQLQMDTTKSVDTGVSYTANGIINVASTRIDNLLAPIWCSAPLSGSGTISAQTWTIAFNFRMASTNMGSSSNVGGKLSPVIYVWRPSSAPTAAGDGTVVGLIFDSSTPSSNLCTTTQAGNVWTVSGSAVSYQDGDVLVLEMWFTQFNSMTTNGASNYAYQTDWNGATDPAQGTASTSAASYLSITQTLTFQSAYAVANRTRLYLRDTASATTYSQLDSPRFNGAGSYWGGAEVAIDAAVSGARTLSATKGTTRVSHTQSVTFNATPRHLYWTTWASDTLDNQTIPASTWRILTEGTMSHNAASVVNNFCEHAHAIYIYRPSVQAIVYGIHNSLDHYTYSGVGEVYFINPESGGGGTAVSSGTPPKYPTYVTKAVPSFTVLRGDILVVEVWASLSGMADIGGSTVTTSVVAGYNGTDDEVSIGGGFTMISTTGTASTAAFVDGPPLTFYSGPLFTTYTKTVGTNAVLQRQNTLKTTAADAWLYKHGTKTANADAVIVRRLTKTTNGDGLLQRKNVLRTATADAWLHKITNLTAQADARLWWRQTRTANADAWLYKHTAFPVGANAVLKQFGAVLTTSASAYILSNTTKVCSANAVLRKTQTATALGDAAIVLRTPLAVSANAVLVIDPRKTFADATLRKTQSALTSADGVLKQFGRTTTTGATAVVVQRTATTTSANAVLVSRAYTLGRPYAYGRVV